MRQKYDLLSGSSVHVQTQRRERKEGKSVVQTNSKVTLYMITDELMSRVWPVNAFKKFNFFQTQLEAIQEHLSSYCTFHKHTNSEV